MLGVAGGLICQCEAGSWVVVKRCPVITGAGFVGFGWRSLNIVGRARPHCAFMRPVPRRGIAGWVGVPVPVFVIVCVKGLMPSVIGNILVGFPRLVAAAAAAKEKGDGEDQQGEYAA